VYQYLNNIVEQDHRTIKRMVKAMLRFKAFWSAAITIAGIEIMHMIRKGQLRLTQAGHRPASWAASNEISAMQTRAPSAM
jgi:putative transposase